MSKRYGDRGFGRYGDSDEDRTEDRDYDRETERGYGEGETRYRPLPDYGMSRRGGGYYGSRGGGEYGREREYGPREQDAREYGSRYAPRGEYGAGEYGSRYGREGLGGGGYAGSTPRRQAGEEYGREYGSRAYGRDYERAERPRPARGPEGEGVRDYDTDYGRTTSRFYGRSGYEYGRDEYDRDDDDRDERGEYGRRALHGRGDDREGRGRGWWDRAADEVLSWFGGPEGERGGRREDPRGGRAAHGAGKFRGRGPRNYSRSDERIREEVCDHLTDNEWLDASDVEVHVTAGEVVLSGAVDSRYAKRLAEGIAESVSGVTNVSNNLRVHNYQAVETSAQTPALPAGTPGAAYAADPETPASGDATEPDISTRAAGS